MDKKRTGFSDTMSGVLKLLPENLENTWLEYTTLPEIIEIEN